MVRASSVTDSVEKNRLASTVAVMEFSCNKYMAWSAFNDVPPCSKNDLLTSICSAPRTEEKTA
jgi:hypothetical protein